MSIVRRFLFSVGANVARAGISMAVGLLVARGLGPADYGNLAYLLGSFWAIRALLDMGASSAFYTFIAQRHRGKAYYAIYFGWLALQFSVTAALVAAILPQSAVDNFWLGHSRWIILLAFLATFLQNQVWQTVVQMHEAIRLTVRIQIAGLVIITAHLLLVAVMLYQGWLGVDTVLGAIVAEYLVAAIWLSATLHQAAHLPGQSNVEPTDMRAALAAYVEYCRPMLVIAVFTFLHEMTDRWLLQRFGGASQQGFYQVASQLSTISLLATTSVMNILWKEVAEANERHDHARVGVLYQKTTRVLVLVASFVACFLAPWSEELVAVLLGESYLPGWPVLFLMLFYPIHQTIGQINSTIFMSAGLTSSYMKITVSGLLASIPVSCLLLAPASDGWLSGLGLGALGLAIKMVGMNILFVNIQSWIISGHYKIDFDWRSQISAPITLLLLAFAAYLLPQAFVTATSEFSAGIDKLVIMKEMLFAAFFYSFGVLAVMLWRPAIIGLDRLTVETFYAQTRALFKN